MTYASYRSVRWPSVNHTVMYSFSSPRMRTYQRIGSPVVAAVDRVDRPDSSAERGQPLVDACVERGDRAVVEQIAHVRT